MADPVLMLDVQKGEMTALTAGPLSGTKMILIANPLALSNKTTIDEITQPTFTGYAPSAAMTWSAPYMDETGRLVVAGAHKTFIFNGGESCTVYGWGLIEGAGPDLVAAEMLDTPVALTEVDDGITLEAVIPYGS